MYTANLKAIMVFDRPIVSVAFACAPKQKNSVFVKLFF